MIGAASRSFTETEKRYATIEKEAIAVVWGLGVYSRYIETMLIRDERSVTVINSIKSIFAWNTRKRYFR